MKSILTAIAATGLFAALLLAQPPRYILKDLGTLPGGTFSQASVISSTGVVSGVAIGRDGTQHAVLWQGGGVVDIGIPGLGGPNSAAFGAEAGQVVGQAESSDTDPNHENFCGYGTGFKCLPFLWQGGLMTQLPLLGGHNGSSGPINIRGEISGTAETGVLDPECPPGVAGNGTGPQLLDYEAVIWGPKPGQIRRLDPLPGDSVGMALWINDNGQAVGISGRCGNTVIPPIAFGPHAVLWDKDGAPHDLGNLGSANLNAALGINNLGQVVGASALAADSTPFNKTDAFLWTKEKGILDLHTLPGDVASGGLGINDAGTVVGVSIDATGSPRAFVWQNGVMTDLNTLVPPQSPLHLMFASVISARGQIAGYGVTSTGDTHGFLAIPLPSTTASAGPKSTTVTTRELMLDATASTSFDAKALTYAWSIPQGSPSAAILHGDTATPTVQFTTRGLYTFQLTVTDSTGNSESDTVTVNFQGN